VTAKTSAALEGAATRRRPHLPGPLRSAGFRRYLAGQLPSVTGSWAQVVALSWTVVDRDPRALGWVVALQFLPSLALGPWFGVVVDRHDRQRLLVLAEASLGLVAASYAVAAATDRLGLTLIGVLATIWGVCNALDTPARRALIPMLVPREHAARASALAGIVLLLGMTAGSALGAVLVATSGVTIAFTVNAATFLGDAILLATIRVGASPRVVRAPGQVRDGIRYVLATPPLRATLSALAILAGLAFTVQVSVPTLVRSGWQGGPSVLGAAFTALTFGSLAGAVIGATRTLGMSSLRLAAVAMAAASAVTAAAPTEPAGLAGLAGIGLAWSVLIGSALAVLQTAESVMMGRVMSLFALVLLSGNTLGGPVAAIVATLAGPRAPFLLGAAAAAASLTAARAKSIRHRDASSTMLGPPP
jgi:MFS family permease